MYESPVELFDITSYVKKVNEAFDEYIYESIIKCGVNVNKEELIKALQYDREQYEKGYKDGLKAIDWHPYPKEKPTESKEYFVTLKYTKCVAAFDYDPEWNEWRGNEGFYVPNNCVIAWAELPEPYKEEPDE